MTHSKRYPLPRTSTSLIRRMLVFWKDPIAIIPFRLVLLFTILLIGIVIVFFWRLPPEIPLMYSRPWGTEQLAPSFFLFILILFIILIIAVNSLLAIFLISEVALLARMLMWSTALVVFLVDVTVLRVLLLIT